MALPVIQPQVTSQVRYGLQSSMGAIATGVGKILPRTSFGLAAKRATFESSTVRSDFMREAVLTGTQSTEGQYETDLGIGMVDDFLAAVVMQRGWTAGPISHGAYSFVGASQVVERADGGSFINDGFHFGMTIQPSGATKSVNNTRATIVGMSADGTSMTLLADNGVVLVDEAGDTITLSGVGKFVVAGTAQNFYTFETFFDKLGKYREQTDVVVNQIAISAKPNSMTTCQIGLMGLAEAPMVTASTFSSTISVPYNPNYKLSGKKGYLIFNGAVIGVITDISLTIAANWAKTDALFEDASVAMTPGTRKVSGSLSVILTDTTFQDNFNNETINSIITRLEIPGGAQFLTAAMSNVTLTAADINLRGMETVISEVKFEASLDGTTGTDIFLQSTAAV